MTIPYSRARSARGHGGLAIALMASLLVWGPPLQAQAGAQATDATMPAANPADVGSMDAILRALYDVISGPAGQARNWTRFRSLFVQGARLIPTRSDSSGHVRTVVWSPDEFVKNATAVLQKEDFYENEIGRSTDTFGAVTQVFSAYASRRTPTGTPFARGINSIQLFNDGTRWYVVTIYWQAEHPGLTVPPKYLAGTP
jgi:hypothetical protein